MSPVRGPDGKFRKRRLWEVDLTPTFAMATVVGVVVFFVAAIWLSVPK